MDDQNKVIIFERNNLLFAFNFHGSHSIADYRFHAPLPGSYKMILSTDDQDLGGFGRVDRSIAYHTVENDNLSIYLPSRTAVVLKKKH
jgi:1,4-alpha-glucan branching enzyme